MMDVDIKYAVEPYLDVQDFKNVLISSGLSESRPIADEGRLSTMLANASLILTARTNQDGRPIVGVARGITDGAWCCYIAELAVCRSMQGQGVGKSLLSEAKRHVGPQVSVILVSMPDAVKFYERADMARIEDAFWIKREV